MKNKIKGRLVNNVPDRIAYKDTFLTLKNYKTPLREIENGYGYYGALLSTIDGSGVQCHICGELLSDLSGHIRIHDKITVPEYREKFMLSVRTALISEDERLVRANRTIKWMKSHKNKKWQDTATEAEKKAHYKRMNEARWAFKRGLSLETKNKRGTCPDQLLDKILEVAHNLGKTPTVIEFIDETGGQRFTNLINKTFGSWSNALKEANLELHKQVHNGGRHKFEHEGRGYSDDQLLEYIRIFAEENRRIPTQTDCKRGLLPEYSCYKRFGGLPTAREIANISQFLDN